MIRLRKGAVAGNEILRLFFAGIRRPAGLLLVKALTPTNRSSEHSPTHIRYIDCQLNSGSILNPLNMFTAADREYLLTLEAVREQAGHVYEAAVAGRLRNFDYHASELEAAADYVVSLILVW